MSKDDATQTSACVRNPAGRPWKVRSNPMNAPTTTAASTLTRITSSSGVTAMVMSFRARPRHSRLSARSFSADYGMQREDNDALADGDVTFGSPLTNRSDNTRHDSDSGGISRERIGSRTLAHRLPGVV